MNSKPFFSLLLVLVLVSCSNVSSENIVVSTPPPGATVIPTLTLKVPATLPGVSSDIIHSTGEIVLLDYALSPDGDRLAVYDNTGVFVYKLDTMQKVTLTEFNDSNYSTFLSGAIAFSLDGEKIAVSGKFMEAEIAIWDIATRKLVETVHGLPDGYYVTEVEFSPNDEEILVRNTNREAMHCQGYGIDRVTLHVIHENTQIFQMDKCVIYPPLRFDFIDNDSLFLYAGTMSPEYTIYFVDTNTGKIIRQENLNWGDNGNFYGISPDGKMFLVETGIDGKRITQLVDSFSNHVLDSVEGKIRIIHGAGSYVIESYDSNTDWILWESDALKCSFDGVRQSHAIKTSRSGDVFALVESETHLQIWKVSTCKLIGELLFDRIRW